MRRWPVLLLAVLAGVAAAAVDPLPFRDQAQRDRFNALAAELRCMVCQNQSLADSDAPLARDLRRELFELIDAGKTDAEVKTYLTDRYGDFVLYRPPLDRRTWWLWFGPGLLGLLALAVVVAVVRRRGRNAQPSALQPTKDEEW
jgi:cytochrome c-type biogenesis protein CcmH